MDGWGLDGCRDVFWIFWGKMGGNFPQRYMGKWMDVEIRYVFFLGKEGWMLKYDNFLCFSLGVGWRNKDVMIVK